MYFWMDNRFFMAIFASKVTFDTMNNNFYDKKYDDYLPLAPYRYNDDLVLFYDQVLNAESLSVKSRNTGYLVLTACLSGELHMNYGHSVKILYPGDVGISQRGSLGGFKWYRQDTRITAIMANEEFISLNINAEDITALSTNILQYPYVHLEKDAWEFFLDMCKLLRGLLSEENKTPYMRFSIKSLYESLLFFVLSNYGKKEESVDLDMNIRTQEIFHRFVKLVQENYAKHKSMPFYADKLHLTPKYLSQVIYNACGKHASVLIEQYRLNEAKSMLRNSELSVQIISDALHFASSSYFCRYFKKKMGISPLEYRVSQHNK